jgi:hypothetical protein
VLMSMEISTDLFGCWVDSRSSNFEYEPTGQALLSLVRGCNP